MPSPTLRRALEERRFVVAPGVFDMISAKVADGMGFSALYATGFGTVASHLGLPDAGLATYTDMLSRVGAFAEAGFRQRLGALGIEPDLRPAAALAEEMRREDAFWAAAARAGTLKPPR